MSHLRLCFSCSLGFERFCVIKIHFQFLKEALPSRPAIRNYGQGGKIFQIGPLIHAHSNTTTNQPPLALIPRWAVSNKLLAISLVMRPMEFLTTFSKSGVIEPFMPCSVLHKYTKYDKAQTVKSVNSKHREKISFKLDCDSYIPPFILKQNKERKNAFQWISDWKKVKSNIDWRNYCKALNQEIKSWVNK